MGSQEKRKQPINVENNTDEIVSCHRHTKLSQWIHVPAAYSSHMQSIHMLNLNYFLFIFALVKINHEQQRVMLLFCVIATFP